MLVLGGNGFIGSHIVDELVRNNYKVRAFDRFADVSITKFEMHPNIDVINGDFSNIDDVCKALEGVDYVLHAISSTTPITSDNDPEIEINTNIRSSVVLFNSIVKNTNINRVLYLSSGGAVYGENVYERPITELDPTYPISPYGIGKLTIENYLHYFNKKHGLEYTVLRIANPYGTRQAKTSRQGVIPIFMDKIIKGEEIEVFGNGSMTRDYIFNKDLAKIAVKMLGNKQKHSVYNVGSGKGYALNDIIKMIEQITHCSAIIKHTIKPKTFVQSSILDTTRLQQALGWGVSFTELKDGIYQTYKELYG